MLQDSRIYRLLPHDLLPLGNGQICLVCEGASKRLILSLQDIDIIRHLGKRGSLREFLRRGIYHVLCLPTRVIRLLTLLVEANVLVEERRHYTARTTAELHDNTRPLTVIINTADRVASCGRCLASVSSAGNATGELNSLLIVDGSRREENSIHLRNQIQATWKRRDINTMYFGAHERAQVIDYLIRQGFDRQILSFILAESQNTFSAGAARNLSILLTAGRDVLTIDDDAIWRFYAPANPASSSLSLSGERRNWSIYFYPTRQEALQSHSPAVTNVANAARQILGRRIGQIAGSWRGEIDDSHACKHMEESILNGTGLVVAVQVGTIGDSGWHTTELLSAYDEQLAHRFDESRSVLDTSLASREVCACSNTYSINHDANCMAIGLFLHNSAPLPPFMPQHRNEDGVFGALLRRCLPQGYFAHVPFAMLHDAPARHGYRHVHGVRVCEIVLKLIAETGPAEPLDLGALGLYLTEIAGVPERTWNAYLGRLTARIQAARIEAISGMLRSLTLKNGHARHHLQRCRDRLIEELISRRITICEYEDPVRLKQFLTGFGEMCKVWPLLRECALQQTNRLSALGSCPQ
jgi:hypothetical protein